jgi:hypothetical protein
MRLEAADQDASRAVSGVWVYNYYKEETPESWMHATILFRFSKGQRWSRYVHRQFGLSSLGHNVRAQREGTT